MVALSHSPWIAPWYITSMSHDLLQLTASVFQNGILKVEASGKFLARDSHEIAPGQVRQCPISGFWKSARDSDKIDFNLRDLF